MKNKTFVIVVSVMGIVIVGLGIALYLSGKDSEGIFSPNQTSASFLEKRAQQLIELKTGKDKEIAIQKHEIIFDIYIKSRSYSFLNKIFFWLSLCAAICVLAWPSVTVIFADKLEKWKWLKSATIQTTITGIAALTFAFYSQYKDKQVYTETLMRHVLYQDDSIQDLSLQVSEELARIDRGFSFGGFMNEDKEK